MVDVNIEIERDLKNIGIEAVYFFPENFNTLPVVSFYNLFEGSHMSCDNSELILRGVVQIDVWDKNPAEIGRIASRIKNGLTQNGWVREMAMDVANNGDNVYHRTMRFCKIFMED